MSKSILNKKARFDYNIIDTIEAGIVLTGDEVKAIRLGHVNMTGSFATCHGNELFMINCHISQYEKAFLKDDKLATRSRKLLLNRKEINRLIGDISRKGVTLIPTKIYFNSRNKIKVEIGIGKHKNSTDKKNVLKERDLKRETSRELKEHV